MITVKNNKFKTCHKCKIEKNTNVTNWFFHKGIPHGDCKLCQASPEQREYRKGYARKLRMMALVNYSGEIPSCACCKEQEMKFLGIDHINGGGGKHRKEIREAGLTTYLWLRKNDYPEGFQVLCHNCNLSKGYYGECPHNLIKT